MNRNDFYKELMSRYALDEEKIRLNAIKQGKKPAWQRIAADYWKPALGTAAAAAVTIAAVGYAADSSVPPAPPVVSSVLSASQRLSEAEQNYYNLQAENPFADIYITFNQPVSYSDFIMALSTIADSGEIRIDSLYLENDILQGGGVRDYAASYSGEKEITAAKVNALSMYYRDIQDLPLVYLAELGSAEINDETFSPMPVEDYDPLMNDVNYFESAIPVTAAPAATTTAFSFDSSTTAPEAPAAVASESGDSTLAPPEEDDPEGMDPVDDDPIPEDTSIDPDDPETTELPETEETEPEFTEPDETVPEESSAAVETPPNEITQDGDHTSLLTEMYELNVENSLETCLCGNNAIVLAKNKVCLFTLGGAGMSQSRTVDMNNPKISFKSNETVIITGCDGDGVRNIIAVVSTETDEIHAYDVSSNIGDARLGAIQYYPAGDVYFIKSVLGEKSFVYEAAISPASGIQFRPLAEADGPVSIVGCKDDLLYLTDSDRYSGSTRLYSFRRTDGLIVEIANFGVVMKPKRGADMESFALMSDESSFIYDVNTGMLVSGAVLDEYTELVTSGGKTCFRTAGTVYEIDAAANINAVQRSVSFNQEITSSFEVSYTAPEKVVVVRKADSPAWAG